MNFLELLIDVDGVVADFTNHLLKIIGSDKRIEDIKNWDIKEYLTVAQKKELEKQLNHNQGDFWRTQPVIRGAISNIKKLKKDGNRIHWVTSPWHSCPVWENARREWLKKNFDAEPFDITFTYKKYKIEGDVLIDDKPSHIQHWAEKHPGGLGILFSAPYNENTTIDLPNWITAKRWPDVIKIVTQFANGEFDG